jgi:adenine/guanine phosphoribosyltransferase-like PRPP-binding protein
VGWDVSKWVGWEEVVGTDARGIGLGLALALGGG